MSNKKLSPTATRGMTVAEKLRHYTAPSGDGCWPWTGTLNENGYGQFYHKGKLRSAHRESFKEHIGPIPKGCQVRHMCDNKGCVNPAHLGVGTPGDNVRDMLTAPGYSPRKLDAQKVAQMRELYATGRYTKKEVGERFGVNTSTAAKVINRRSWRYVA